MIIAIVTIIVVLIIIAFGARCIDKSWYTYGDILGNDKDNTDKLDKLDEL